jgi:hypothetical protein
MSTSCAGKRVSHLVRNCCSLFVTILDSKIYLIYQTAKAFLVSNSAATRNADLLAGQAPSSSGVWNHCIELAESHCTVAEICVSYLLFTVFESQPLEIDEKSGQHSYSREAHQYLNTYPFLDYSAKNWAFHF